MTNENKKVEKLCLLSILNVTSPFWVNIINAFISMILRLFKLPNEIVTLIITNISFLMPLVGLVLMVYIRIKYPNNTSGKVIMWLCIIGIIVIIIFIALSIISCLFCESFIDALGCPR